MELSPLLSAPSFRSKYMRSMNLLVMGDSENDSTPLSLLGFFQGSTWPEEISDQTAPRARLSYLPSTEPFMPLKSRKFMDDPDCFFVGSSTSGIILCGRHPSTYFVCSPLADRWVRLPPPNDKTCGAMNVAVGFSFVAYDSDASHNRVWLIELPPSTGVQNVVLGESSSDALLQCGIDDNVGSSLGLKVLRLQKNLHGYGCTAMVWRSSGPCCTLFVTIGGSTNILV